MLHSRRLIVPLILAILTGFGIVLSATTVGTLPAIAPPAGNVPVDEATYYKYVAPRLDRLLTELEAVQKLTDDRSRDVVSLGLHAKRIETLADQIRAVPVVPTSMSELHTNILESLDSVTDTIASARSSLLRFDFTQMPTLSDNFKLAISQLSEYRSDLEISVADHQEDNP